MTYDVTRLFYSGNECRFVIVYTTNWLYRKWLLFPTSITSVSRPIILWNPPVLFLMQIRKNVHLFPSHQVRKNIIVLSIKMAWLYNRKIYKWLVSLDLLLGLHCKICKSFSLISPQMKSPIMFSLYCSLYRRSKSIDPGRGWFVKLIYNLIVNL